MPWGIGGDDDEEKKSWGLDRDIDDQPEDDQDEGFTVEPFDNTSHEETRPVLSRIPGISPEDGWSRRNIIVGSGYTLGIIALAGAGEDSEDGSGGPGESSAENSQGSGSNDGESSGGSNNGGSSSDNEDGVTYGKTNPGQLAGYLNVLEKVVPDASEVGTEVRLEVLRLDGDRVGVDATHFAQTPQATHLQVEMMDVIDAYQTVIGEGHNVARMEAEVLLQRTKTHLGDYTVKRAWAEESLTDTELLNRVIEHSTLGIPPLG